MADELVLSLGEARRLAIRSQHLAGPEPAEGIDGMRQVLRGLRVLQIDPVNVVARSHLLVLWSRLGGFDRDDLETLRWRERWLFEYWAHAASIVLTEDYPIHRAMMRAYRVTVESQQKRDWLAANEDFRRYVLDLLRDSGPLPGDAIEDRAAVSWISTGWTNGRNVERMLDILWKQGVVMVTGRDGLRRLWGLADFPGGGGPAAGGGGGAGRRARAARSGGRPDARCGATLHHRAVPGAGPGACGLGATGPSRGRERAVVGTPGRARLLDEDGGRGRRCSRRSTT